MLFSVCGVLWIAPGTWATAVDLRRGSIVAPDGELGGKYVSDGGSALARVGWK